MDDRPHQDDHYGDEELKVVAAEEGLDGEVNSRADGDLVRLFDGGHNHGFEPGEQVCELLVGVRLQVVGVA